MEYCGGRLELVYLGGLNFECSELNGLFFGNLEEKC